MTAWMRLTGENPLQLVRIRDNFFGYADMSDGFLRLIVIDGDLESDFFRIADAFLAEGGVFLDVGANHGLFSCGLAGRYADKVQFHLFEPNPKLIASIQQSVALYPSMQHRINLAAISDRIGIVSFEINEQQSGASHISDNNGMPVPTTTLDHYLEEAQIPQVTLLKIDIEGYELLALRGARRSLETRRIQAIYFEYFEKYLARVSAPAELLAFLDAQGYEVCFCRQGDLSSRGGASLTVRKELPGHGVPLLPVRNHELPAMTDLLAVPKENVISIAT